MMKRNLRLAAFTVGIVALMVTMTFLPASAQLSQWRSLNPTRNGTLVLPAPFLYGVQMLTSSYGWAVGGTCDIYTLPLGADCPGEGFVLYWDGAKWRRILTPPGIGTLASVFAVSANDVWAVGPGPTVIHWDGTSWVSLSAAVLALGVTNLLSVFMLPGGTDGWAVGDGGTTDNIRWSGTWPTGAWSAGSTANLLPGSAANQFLRGVSLSSPTFGWIVGSGGQIFKWDGAGWLAALSPVAVDLLSVFAMSVNDAWGVGQGSTIIRWNGASWTGPMVAPTSISIDYRSVRMVSETDGWIAGTLNPTSQEGTLLRWNGAAWTIVRSWVTVDLNGLSILPGGIAGSAVGDAETIIHWNGSTWFAQTSPTGTNLNAVSMVASNNGWAVGDHGTIFSYDGTSWSHYETLPSGVILYGLHMRTSTDGWAVGEALPITNPSGFPPTILHWNGAAWTAITPSGVALGQTLYAVDTLSATEGWAVGDGNIFGDDTVAAAMLKWDGSIWTSVPSGTPIGARLYSIDMVSSTDGWAVGCTDPLTLCATPVIVRWNGLAWSQVTPPTNIAGLYDVFMLSPTDGWAVGNAQGGQATIVHWDGTQWRRAPGPATGANGFLRSVHMVSSTDGWAVGQVDMVSAPDGVTGPRSLIVHWDGMTWDVVATPPLPPTMSVALQSVFMVAALDGWIASGQGLILHYGPEFIPATTTSTSTITETTTETSTSTSTSTTSTTSTSTSVTSPPPGPVPGFPIESILAGLLGGLIALTIIRRRRKL